MTDEPISFAPPSFGAAVMPALFVAARSTASIRERRERERQISVRIVWPYVVNSARAAEEVVDSTVIGECNLSYAAKTTG
jgi:hypothetical protein